MAMLRKFSAVLLAAALILCVSGCGRKSKNSNETRMFMYEYDEELEGIKIITYIGLDQTEVTIPKKIDGKPVVCIGNSSFKMCSDIKSLTIPDSVTTIERAAFSNCESLETVNIPSSVKNIEIQAFIYCSSLREFTVDDNNEYYSTQDGVLFNKDKTLLVQYPIGKDGDSYKIPESVTSLGNSSFISSKLKSVAIPDTVTSIAVHTFTYCEDLDNITYKGITYGYDDVSDIYDKPADAGSNTDTQSTTS
jgi:hypothetical protein